MHWWKLCEGTLILILLQDDLVIYHTVCECAHACAFFLFLCCARVCMCVNAVIILESCLSVSVVTTIHFMFNYCMPYLNYCEWCSYLLLSSSTHSNVSYYCYLLLFSVVTNIHFIFNVFLVLFFNSLEYCAINIQ